MFSPEFAFQLGFGFGRVDNRSLFLPFSGNKLRRKETFFCCSIPPIPVVVYSKWSSTKLELVKRHTFVCAGIRGDGFRTRSRDRGLPPPECESGRDHVSTDSTAGAEHPGSVVGAINKPGGWWLVTTRETP